MEIKCTVQELKELLNKETSVAGTTDELSRNLCNNQTLPPHEFPLLNVQEYQHIYKEVQQEVPKED